MRLEPVGVVADVDGTAFAVPLSGTGSVETGPVQVDIAHASTDWSVSVANRGDTAIRLRSIALVFEVVDAVEPVRMFRHGYQSWSPSAVATFGVDVDPSHLARFEFLQAVHHADQRTVEIPEQLRSEWLTVLADETGAVVLAGFLDGAEHDGTFRLQRAPTRRVVELCAEGFFGDAVVEPGERRPLHRLMITGAPGGSAADLLDAWAASAGAAGGARVRAPYQVGWCSWYHYFHDVTEKDILANLALAEQWPFDVFQLDDGYQSAVGDWLTTNEMFPAGLPAVARGIAAAGLLPGIWLAPFLAAPDSRVATGHPDWLAGHAGSDGRREPLYPWWNPSWGGGRDGLMYALDTTNDEVLAHLESLARTLVEMGFRYLKLDFTFAPSVDGIWADPSRTPAQRVRAGFDAIRRGAGDDVFVLGCGVPLAHVVGVVDGNRIGPDVAPWWGLDASAEIVKGYLGVQPATRHAYLNTVTRSFLHRRLWLNDPDCVMLRTRETQLSPDAMRTWARTVGISGGMALVSDDLALLDNEARSMLDEVLAIGRASDELARGGRPAAVADLMRSPEPTTFSAAGWTVVTDPRAGESAMRH